MADEKQLRIAVAQLRGFRSHVHTPITQAMVDEYQSIIKTLEEATGEFLQHFSISPASMNARPLPERRRARGFSALVPQFTDEKYCDKDLFEAKIAELWKHIEERPRETRQ
ncbi:MAG TPA: hypothetical protein VGI45_01325 [Terracidiphilus sp.]|jgi:hypothetical protein